MSNRKRKHSIFVDEVTNIIDWENKEIKTEIIKHLNKCKVDRGWGRSGKWNKSGIKSREKKVYQKHAKIFDKIIERRMRMNYEYNEYEDRADW